MPQIDPQVLMQARQEAARRGLSVDAYLRLIQNQTPGMGDAPVMPKQMPFAEGPGPGGGYGGGGGQTQQPWQQYMPQGQPGIGAQISPAGGPGEPDGGVPDPTADASIFGQLRNALSYGGISFGDRLGNASSILAAFADPHGRSLAPAVSAAGERMSGLRDLADRKEAYYADQAKQQQMAESIYNNLKDSNPQAAAAILADPSLVKDWMKGTLDIEQTKIKEGLAQDRELAVQSAEDEGAMAREVYKTEHDPKTLAMQEWRKGWKEFVESTGLEDSSTQAIYKEYTKDESLTQQEAQRLANANLRGGQEALDEEYAKVIDDRGKRDEITIAKEAAALAGINLKPGQIIKNKEEVVASGGKVAPITGWAEGTEEAEAAEASKSFNWKMDSQDYLSTQRAIDALDQQISGKTMTGSGVTGYARMLPITNSRELNNALTSINAGQAFQKLQDLRKANPNGAGVGNVTEGEYPIMTAAEGEKFDILQEPELLKKRLTQHQNVGMAFMSLAPGDNSKSLLQYLVEGLRADPSETNRQKFDEKFGSGYAAMIINTQGDIPR